jgi:uncharacterized protein
VLADEVFLLLRSGLGDPEESMRRSNCPPKKVGRVRRRGGLLRDRGHQGIEMNTFEAAYSRWVVRNRVLIIILCLIVVAALGRGVTKLAFDTSYRAFFSEDNPELIAFEKLENTYVKDDNVMLVVAPNNGDIFTRENLQAIEELTEASWQIPYSNRVDSITNFQHTEAELDDLIVRDMVKDAQSFGDEELASARKTILAEPSLVNRLVSAKGHVSGINITVQMQIEERAHATGEIVDFVREIISEFKQRHPDIEIYLTGMVMMDQAFFENAVYDMTVLFPVSFGLMIVLLGLLAGGFFGTLTTLAIIAFSIVGAMGVGGHVGYPVTGLATSVPIIILTVAVANCVHVLVTFAHELHGGRENRDAMEESLRVNLQPVALASLTTAIGFLSMNFSEVPPFAHLGTLVSVGVLLSFVLSVSFLPAVMTLSPIKARKLDEDDYRLMSRFADFVIARRKSLLIVMSCIVFATVANLPRNEINDIFLYYFDESGPFRIDSDFMIENLSGIDFINFSADSGRSGGISDPVFQADVEKFARWLETQPETVHVDRITNVMKRLSKNMHGDDEAYYRLPKTRDLAAQYLLLYEMSLPYGLDLNNQINVDKSQTKLTATTATISSQQMIDLNKRALAWAGANAPSFVDINSAGVSLMFAYIGQRNNYSMIIGTTIALILISGVLVIALRSLKIGVVSLLPNLAPAAVAFGLWGVFVGEVGLSLSIVAGMTFGIVVDDCVHFLSKYLRARREKGLDAPQAVRYAFRTVGRALVVTTVILVTGFAVIATSKFSMNSDMGLMTGLIMLIALSTVFLMLPPLLIALERDRPGSNHGAQDGKSKTLRLL